MSENTPPVDDGRLPACGCGWLFPTGVTVRTPALGVSAVVVVMYCPRCEARIEAGSVLKEVEKDEQHG